jgi:hypothetical protein
MTKSPTARYCADPQAISAMARDGLGWGHDLECGTFHTTAHPPKPGRFTQWFFGKGRG